MKCLLCGSEEFDSFNQLGVMNTQPDKDKHKVKEIAFSYLYCLGCGNITIDLKSVREVQDGYVWI